MFEFEELPKFKFETQEDKEDALDREIRELLEERFEVTEEELNVTKIYQLGADIRMHRDGINSITREIDGLTNKKLENEKEILRIQSEARKAMEGLMAENKEITTKIFDLRKEKRKLQDGVESLERKLQIELDNIRNSLAFKANIKAYEQHTAGLFWREWAMGHQIEGAEYLANGKRCILGDKMGLGKTLTLLVACDMVQAKRVLIICPADVTSNFEKEAKHWAPHRTVMSLYKWPKGQRDIFLHTLKQVPEFLMLINYDAWRKDKELPGKLAALGFDAVICDEAHSIKNASSVAFHGVRDIVMAENVCPKCNSLQVTQIEIEPRRFAWHCSECDWDVRDGSYDIADRRSVKYMWTATGTPILNRPQELYTQLHLIMPDIFKREVDFLDEFCVQDYNGYWKWAYGGLDRLQNQLSGRIIIRDRKILEDQGIKLPTQQVIPHEIEITADDYPDQHRIIKQLQEHYQIVLASGRKIAPIAMIEVLLRQRQANVWPGGITVRDEDGLPIWTVGDEVRESIKIDRAVKLIDEFTMDNQRCVVFSQFTGPLHEAADRLNAMGIKSVVFDGSTPVTVRDQIKEDFDRKSYADPDYVTRWDVVLCNYKTGGVGLNFTAATQTIVLDEEWNPGKNEQAWGRTDRIGQTEENFVHILRLKNTVDKWLADLIEYKAAVVAGFEVSADEMQQKMIEGLRDDSL